MFCRLDNLSAHIKKTHGVTWQVRITFGQNWNRTFSLDSFWQHFKHLEMTWPLYQYVKEYVVQRIAINDLLTGGRKDDKHKCEGRSASTKDFVGSWLKLLWINKWHWHMNHYYTFAPWRKSSMIPTRISCSLPEFFHVPPQGCIIRSIVPTIWDGSTWSKFGARGEHGDVP